MFCLNEASSTNVHCAVDWSIAIGVLATPALSECNGYKVHVYEIIHSRMQNLATSGQMTCFVDFLSENKLTHPLQRTFARFNTQILFIY